MPKFKVTATLDVGYEIIIEARNGDEAWAIAKNKDDLTDWVQADEGHDWTMEDVWKETGDE